MTPSAIPAAHGAPVLSPTQLAMFRDQLDEQVRFRTSQLRRLREQAQHHAGGSDEIEQSLTTAARAALRDLTHALQRLADGTYGWCIDCGDRLPIERLEVVPQVARCLSCQREAELG